MRKRFLTISLSLVVCTSALFSAFACKKRENKKESSLESCVSVEIEESDSLVESESSFFSMESEKESAESSIVSVETESSEAESAESVGSVVESDSSEDISNSFDDGVSWDDDESSVEENLSEFIYTLSMDGKYYEIAAGRNFNGTEISIPTEYNGKPIREIAPRAFFGSAITSVYIPASIKVIRECAFEECDDLRTVTFEETTDWTIVVEGLANIAMDVADAAKYINGKEAFMEEGSGVYLDLSQYKWIQRED